MVSITTRLHTWFPDQGDNISSSQVPYRTKWLLFDVGGVLIESPHDFAAFANELSGDDSPATLAGVRRSFDSHRDAYDRGASAAWFWTEVANDAGAPHPNDGTIRSLVTLEQQRWSSPSPATLAALERCKAAGHSLAILSNAPHELADILQAATWTQLFDHIMTSARLGSAKPDAAVWQMAVKQLGTTPTDISFFDDREGNIAAAAAAGIRAHHWTGLGSLEHLLFQWNDVSVHERQPSAATAGTSHS
ncbi:HAD family phosphatase [Cryobacterium sp. SO1]|uniref:HAD family hydrolase n=1 Tax=Cryobacterium sp. SO1 TaxID=1897061 RepID=UPI001022DD63